jgi:hypothetical protein
MNTHYAGDPPGFLPRIVLDGSVNLFNTFRIGLSCHSTPPYGFFNSTVRQVCCRKRNNALKYDNILNISSTIRPPAIERVDRMDEFILDCFLAAVNKGHLY